MCVLLNQNKMFETNNQKKHLKLFMNNAGTVCCGQCYDKRSS